MKGRYAVIEGLDFAGKSELAKAVAARLGWALVSEPYTGNEHAAEVKRMNNANYLPKHYEMMMILAGRIDCFDEVIDKHRVSGIIRSFCRGNCSGNGIDGNYGLVSRFTSREPSSFCFGDLFNFNSKYDDCYVFGDCF
jgi:hypothetical protein